MIKRSVSINGHRTSFSLEQEFHDELECIASRRGIPVARLVTAADSSRHEGMNLSSALRLLVLEDLKSRAQKNPDN